MLGWPHRMRAPADAAKGDVTPEEDHEPNAFVAPGSDRKAPEYGTHEQDLSRRKPRALGYECDDL